MNHLRIERLLTPQEGAALQHYCDRMLQPGGVPGEAVPYFESGRLIRIERMMEHLEATTGLPLLERCRAIVRQETGCNAKLFKDKINFRHPGAAGFGAHQDAAAGWARFSPIFHSVALFVRDSDAVHGGFEFSMDDPGAAFYPKINGQIGGGLFESFRRCNIIARAGDAIFFDSFAPHRSHANLSDDIVPHLILTFNPAEYGDQRSAYYESKLAGMQGGEDGYEFRLFDFGDSHATGGR